VLGMKNNTMIRRSDFYGWQVREMGGRVGSMLIFCSLSLGLKSDKNEQRGQKERPATVAITKLGTENM
jgi:hypothetical protein